MKNTSFFNKHTVYPLKLIFL